MNIVHSPTEVRFDRRTAITIGTFDGVHLGHRAIIETLVARARAMNGRSVVVTFHPHPQVVLRRKGDDVKLLTSAEERDRLLEELGVDIVIILEFTPELAATPWREFIDRFIENVGIGHIVFGHDHAFGRNREGTADALRALGREVGFEVTEVGPLDIEGDAVSSTKIRRALAVGDLETAGRYLGRRYSVTGTVVRGDGRGRTLGIPTANVAPLEEAKLLPADGVYCVEMLVGEERHRGMANIGLRPTFTDATVRTLEVNLFDFDGDLYERTVSVEFVRFVRGERKFASAEEFLEQLARDRAVCGG
jgi:riboflavin kinase/FMN adenylyltransferase